MYAKLFIKWIKVFFIGSVYGFVLLSHVTFRLTGHFIMLLPVAINTYFILTHSAMISRINFFIILTAISAVILLIYETLCPTMEAYLNVYLTALIKNPAGTKIHIVRNNPKNAENTKREENQTSEEHTERQEGSEETGKQQQNHEEQHQEHQEHTESSGTENNSKDNLHAEEHHRENIEQFFAGVHDMEGLNRRRKKLMLIYHSDNEDGDDEICRLINQEYERLKKQFS